MKEDLEAVVIDSNFVNFCLNKFCPYLIVFLLLFCNSGLDFWKGAVICIACLFVDRFSFRAGYSLAYCESHKIDLNKDV